MRLLRLSAIVACLVPASAPAYGDCVQFSTRVFAADAGTAYVRAEIDGAERRTVARLYTTAREGDRLLWTATLVNEPARIWVDAAGRWIVTLGNFCNAASDHDHALTVYDRSGKVIADWRLNELVPELYKYSGPSELHTPWTSVAPLRFEAPFDDLRVIFPWGESKIVNRPPDR
jgi:hypothetical protein